MFKYKLNVRLLKKIQNKDQFLKIYLVKLPNQKLILKIIHNVKL